MDHAALDLQRAPNRLVGLPRRGAAEDRAYERQQRLADLPGGGVPQVGRAVVHRVVVHVAADLDGRLHERRRLRPGESHAFVARDIDDQAAGRERVELTLVEEDQRRIGVLQHAVDDDVVLREELRDRHGPVVREREAPTRPGLVSLEVHDAGRVDRRGHRGDPAVGEDVYVVHPVRVQGRDGPAGGRAEPDHDRAQPAPVVAGHPESCQGVQHRAVPGHLVVLVEHVQVERAVVGPVVHGLERDQVEPLVDRELGESRVLHAVRPAPQGLSLAELGDVLEQRFGQHDDVAPGDQLRARQEARHEGGQLLVRHAERLAVTALQVDAVSEIGRDPVQVQRVDRQPPLVGLAEPRDDSERELLH